MNDASYHDQQIAKLQYFANLMQSVQADKENLLLTIDRESCEKEKLKIQIFLLEELSKEYYDIFKDILYR